MTLHSNHRFWKSDTGFLTVIGSLRNTLKEIKDIIFKELVLKDNLDSYNQKTLDSIIETASVSIHVRRGDYLNLGLELTNWNKYYSDALTYINCRHKIEKVFCFFR